MMEDDFGIGKPAPAANRAAAVSDCSTCGGDKWVTVRLRSPETTMWMREHGLQASTVSFHEEVAPCPGCHHVDVSYWREGGRFRGMDPAQVREAIRP